MLTLALVTQRVICTCCEQYVVSCSGCDVSLLNAGWFLRRHVDSELARLPRPGQARFWSRAVRAIPPSIYSWLDLHLVGGSLLSFWAKYILVGLRASF
jgi:hypothetical protein